MDLITAIGIFTKPLNLFHFAPFKFIKSTIDFHANRLTKMLYILLTFAMIGEFIHFFVIYFDVDYRPFNSHSNTNEIATLVDNIINAIAFIVSRLVGIWYGDGQVKVLNAIIKNDQYMNKFMIIDYTKLRNSLRVYGLVYLTIQLLMMFLEVAFEFEMTREGLMDYLIYFFFKTQLTWLTLDTLMLYSAIKSIYIQTIHLNKYINSGQWETQVEIITVYKNVEVIVEKIGQVFYYIPLGIALSAMSTSVCSVYRTVWMFINQTIDLKELLMNATFFDMYWYFSLTIMLCQIIFISEALVDEVSIVYTH